MIKTMRLTVFLRDSELFWSTWDVSDDDSDIAKEVLNKDPAVAAWQPHAVMFDYVFDHDDKVLAKKKLLEAADRILSLKTSELNKAYDRVHWELGTYEEDRDDEERSSK